MNSKKILTIFLGMVLVIALGILLVKGFSKEDTWICKDGQWVKHGSPVGPAPTGICKEEEWFKISKKEEKTELPNPASQNCINQGGRLEKLVETAGDLGICKFTDGTQCEEWKFFREECQKGQTKTADLSHPYQGVVSKTNSGYIFKSLGVEYKLELPADAAKGLKDRLVTEAKSKEQVTIIAAETPLLSKNLILKSFQEK